MAQHWGRKETIIWPPHAPVVSYGALAAALLLLTCFYAWQRLNYTMTPLQQSCLAAMLWFAIPADLKRFRRMKYSRLLRGPQMMTPKDFNYEYDVAQRWAWTKPACWSR